MWSGKIRPLFRLQDEGSTLRPKGVSKGQSLMRVAMSQLKLSARGYHRTQSVKLARTLAELAASGEIQVAHLAQVLHLR
jgi:predicted ATPase with chaperone activity